MNKFNSILFSFHSVVIFGLFFRQMRLCEHMERCGIWKCALNYQQKRKLFHVWKSPMDESFIEPIKRCCQSKYDKFYDKRRIYSKRFNGNSNEKPIIFICNSDYSISSVFEDSTFGGISLDSFNFRRDDIHWMCIDCCGTLVVPTIEN